MRIQLLLLPLTLLTSALETANTQAEIRNLTSRQVAKRLEFQTFMHRKDSLRNALRRYDRQYATHLLEQMDSLVLRAETSARELWNPATRFATIEEIYGKVFEPGFQAFQQKQRKCRRQHCTYLEYIRQNQKTASMHTTRNAPIRKLSEAIEIIFSIGDMDNTGYVNAPDDAARSAALLKDFCLHLLKDPHVCVVTSRELNDPDWVPPFKHGLIILNLVTHCDEATPGVHLTVIPYSRGYTRGPDAQPALGRALAGMGYPSTWKDILDDNGNPIPKRNRDGKVIYDSDGTPRSKKEPAGQGIIDWIEEQKNWLAQEMSTRYGWKRQYKGSHPRGYLSIPDYQVARAQERLQELDTALQAVIQEYMIKADNITSDLYTHINDTVVGARSLDIILHYLETCSEERFDELLDEALRSIGSLPQQTHDEVRAAFEEIIRNAQKKKSPSDSKFDKSKNHQLD